ncbi:hypothetical protein CsSME_00014617 [Camellia sinensis var. sinensis]
MSLIFLLFLSLQLHLSHLSSLLLLLLLHRRPPPPRHDLIMSSRFRRPSPTHSILKSSKTRLRFRLLSLHQGRSPTRSVRLSPNHQQFSSSD